jgi:hypothetical protein
MNTNKRLVEAVIVPQVNQPDAGVTSFLNRMKGQFHPFMEAWEKNYAKAEADGTLAEYRKEHGMEAQGTGLGNISGGDAGPIGVGTEPAMGALRGQTVGDTVGFVAGYQVAATLEIFNAVVRGFRRYMDDSFVKKYTTESVVFKVPKLEYQEYVADISGGFVPHTEKLIDYATVDLSTPESEKGGMVTWTRALLEDVTFDVQAEMAEGLGHAIAAKMMKDILDTVLAVTAANQPSGATISITDPIQWTEFLSVIGAVDIGVIQTDGTRKTYGPADYCLVSTDVYWQLLNIIQMTNVLYEGSTDPVKKGVINLALGTSIVKQSFLPDGTIVALNSEKAVALVTRRALKIEPILFPVWNEYGFLGTVRYGTTRIFEQAIQLGQAATS